MSLSPEIRDQAYQFFVEEAQELLQTIEMGLLNLHHDRSTAQIHEIMRAAHSLKGGAASIGLEAIKTISHRLETIFKALYSDQVTFDSTLETALLQGYDCLRVPLTTQITTGYLDELVALQQAEPVLSAIETLLGDAIKESEGYVPTSADLGVDIVASIFEVDVAQGLERWQQVLANPEAYPVAGELRAQLEVFSGLAEILELPGFGELTRVALRALDVHPDRSLEVLTVALADFQRARDQVLQGDRRQGGAASAALQQLADPGSGLGEVPSLAAIWGEDDSPEIPLAPKSSGAESGEGREEQEGNSVISDLEASQAADPTDQATNLEVTPSLVDIFGSGEAWGQEGDWRAAEGWEETAVGDAIALRADNDFGGNLGDNFGDNFGGDLGDDFGDNFGSEESLTDSPSLASIFGGLDPSTDLERLGLDDPSLDGSSLGTPSLDAPSLGTPSLDTPSLDAGFGDLVDRTNPAASFESLVEAAIANFDRLPSLAEGATGGALVISPQHDRALVAPTPPTAHPPETTPIQTKRRDPVAGRSIRVDLQRLERMNNLVGELAINRNSLLLQHEQLQNVVRDLGERFTRFQDLLQSLRQSSDSLLVNIAPSHSIFAASSVPTLSTATLSALTASPQTAIPLTTPAQPSPLPSDWEFDQLEMDRYSQVHSQLQEIWESVIQLEESVHDINLFTGQASRSLSQQGRQLNQLQNELMWSRMLPLSEVLNRFPRILRDLANRFQKPVNLKLTGSSVLVDKSILEKLNDPLLHLLRNAFDHGIEPVDVRLNQGKPETATIEIRAYHRGNQTVIEIQDDGRGIDLEHVSRRALELGWITPESLGQLKANQVYNFLFESGFSTAAQVTELSGRGVGLDVVKSQIESLKGSVSVTSTPRQGTLFSLYLPLTLTLTKLLIVQAAQLPIALPSDNLEELVIPKPEQLKQTGSSSFLHWRNQLIPYYNLAALMQYACPVPAIVTLPQLAALQAPPDWLLPMLVVRRGNYSFALQVDRILTEQELVIKPFNPAIAPPFYLYGCTVLEDGRLVPVMDASLLIDYCYNHNIPQQSVNLSSYQHPSSGLLPSAPLPQALHTHGANLLPDSQSDESITPTYPLKASPPAPVHPTILVVDDSTALRQTLALTLQKAGYQVLQARDGMEALTQLQTGQPVGLVICDVEMPNMNGFEFLSQRRQQPNICQIPVFMLTSRSNQKHRKLAETLGATSYFTKPYLEQELLKALSEIFQRC